MAYSDWAIMAIDRRGNPTKGIFRTKETIVKVSKDRLVISSIKDKKNSICLFEGHLYFNDVQILAVRNSGPQGGVAFAVWKGWGKNLRAMVGIGCCGYKLDTLKTEWVGVTPDDVESLKKNVIGELIKVPYTYESGYYLDEETEECEMLEYETILESEEKNGIHTDLIKSLREEWSTECPEELRNINFDKAAYYCYGDEYLGKLEMTIVGQKAELPVVIQWIQSINGTN